MYKTVEYGLLALVGISLILASFNLIPFNPLFLLVSLATIAGVCYVTNWMLGKFYNAPTNVESYLISALILYFIMTPPVNGIHGLIPLVLVSVLAMASKYVFALHNKHLFNPVAIGAVLLGFTGVFGASWWVATPAMLIPTAIIGFLIVRKIRRFSMVLTFMGVALMEMVLFGFYYGVSPFAVTQQGFYSWPLVFFATVMLTEPLTMPPTRSLQMLYGGLVGFLFAFQLPLGPILLSPELALVVGNVFAYFVSFRKKLMLTFIDKVQLSSNMYGFRFKPSESFGFIPGQYFEWTLPHKKIDSRGNRRFFTVASSPTDENVELGVRVEESGSSFKSSLQHLKKGDVITAGNLAGDFTLPEDTSKKLVFIAGGIGVTPFRSIIKYLLDKSEKRDIILFYAASHPDELAYLETFRDAEKKLGIKLVCCITRKENVRNDWNGEVGYLTPEIIKKYVPDYAQRMFYLSGPNAMVNSYKKMLDELKIGPTQIITDYFPGF